MAFGLRNYGNAWVNDFVVSKFLNLTARLVRRVGATNPDIELVEHVLKSVATRQVGVKSWLQQKGGGKPGCAWRRIWPVGRRSSPRIGSE